MIYILKNKINIGYLSTAYHTAFILKESKDFQKHIKSDKEWALFGTGPLMVKAFREERLDIGYMGLPPAIIGIDSGLPIKCVAGGHVEGTIMIAKIRYKNITNLNGNMKAVLSQFIGQTIGVPSKGSIHDVIIRYFIKQNDLQNEITIENYEQAEFIAVDMKKNLLEAGVGTPSLSVFASTILKSHIIIPPSKLWSFNPSYGIFFHENFIKEYPYVGKKFLEHHKRASYMLRNEKKKSAKIISKSFGLINKNYVLSVLKISPKYCIALSEEYVESTMRFIQILHKLGYISKQLSVKDIFDFRFIHEIHPEKEHYSV
ncbi:MAG: ABC transporter substrate-binding protein [Candidatus Hodarchaeota archaeon]